MPTTVRNAGPAPSTGEFVVLHRVGILGNVTIRRVERPCARQVHTRASGKEQ